jgi:uncharacterized damage-inducible protein DinB
MTIAESLLPEYDQEMANTRRMLARVPQDKHDWKPHEKSMTLGRLASHLAEMPTWALQTCRTDELDIAPKDGPKFEAANYATSAEVMTALDKNAAEARAAVAQMADADWMRDWTLLAGGDQIFTMPKLAVYRSMVLNHIIHHRGQLSVYLRLLGTPVPGMYGPSADEHQK